MDKILISPSKYVQGAGVIKRIPEYTKNYKGSVFAIADSFVKNLVEKDVTQSFQDAKTDLTFELFNGECSHKEVNRLKEIVKASGASIIVGIGGGKTIDTAKLLGFYLEKIVIVVPTIASADAPTSALSVIYTEEGAFEEYIFFPTNPHMVIMDTEVIAQAPTRLLVSGMGDALSTYFEARSTIASGKTTMAGGLPTLGGEALSRLCYDTLLADGYKAKIAVDNNLTSKAVENIIEANTLLSGLGFESCGLAAAHSIHNGLTMLEECHHLYHGEKVAFGTLVHLVLENAPTEEYEEVLNFCKSIGLPTSLYDMGVKEVTIEKLIPVAEMACAEGETIFNMPFEVTPESVLSAIMIANELGSK